MAVTTLVACKCAILMPEHALASAAITAFLGYEFADFGSGVYHWSLDNYGSKDTPIMGA